MSTANQDPRVTALALHPPQAASKKFERFDENTLLTTIQVEDANGKAINVYKTLRRLYYENAPAHGFLIIGSYEKNTAIRPPSDIDVVFARPRT